MFQNFKMISSIPFLFLVASIMGAEGPINYVKNGGFQDPLIQVSYQKRSNIRNWVGSFDLVRAKYVSGFTNTQIIDLAANRNGFIQQNVTLPFNGTYVLSFAAKNRATILNESVAEVYWNKELILVCSPLPTTAVNNSIEIIGKSGQNILRFVQVGLNDNQGLLIDDVSIFLIKKSQQLTEQNRTLLKAQQQPLSTQIMKSVFSIVPLQQFKMSQLGFLIEDIWLYVYANRSYSKNVSDIFNIISAVQLAKWNFFMITLKANLTSLVLPFSDYRAHSNPKHLQVDGKDDFMLKSLYFFLILSVPQLIVIISVVKIVFHCLRNYKLSVFLRRFSFFPCALLQSALEGSVSYFAYLSFNQFKIFFSFTVWDKLFLGFTVVFSWGCFAYATCFYVMINYIYEKQAGYFIYCYYRSLPGLLFITVRIGVRALLRGAIFSLCYQHYFLQCAFLIAVELIIIALSIHLQAKHEIFIFQSKFCLQVLHHGLMIAITIAFAAEKTLNAQTNDPCFDLWNNFEILCIYSMAIVAILDFIIELISQKRIYSQQFVALTELSEQDPLQKKKLLTIIINFYPL